MEGTLFGIQKKVEQSSITSASLDKQRVELARKNVRALNNQFVSWVHLQLKNHPDELCEDGINHYLSHASTILEKFKDVVNWLKEIKGNGENVSPEPPRAEDKLVSEVKKSVVKLVLNNSLFASNSQPGLFSNNQSSNFSSSQSGLFSSQPGVFSSSPFGLNYSSQTGSFSSDQFGLTSGSQTGSFSSGQFGLTKSSRPSLFPSSQGGSISNTQSPFSFSTCQAPFQSGVTPVSIPAKREGSDDADAEDERLERRVLL